MTKTDNSAGRWWDWHLFGLWVLVNAAAFAVVPLVGVLVEQVASTAARNLAQDHRALAVVIIAVIGAALQGIVVGRWQWRLLQRRLPGLERRRWVTATVAPAFFVWLLAIAPEAVDLLAKGGNTLTVFRNGFIQALVLGPLIGLSQATALRGHTSRWGWWAVGNVTTYLTGAAAHVLGVWMQHQLSLPAQTPAFFQHGGTHVTDRPTRHRGPTLWPATVRRPQRLRLPPMPRPSDGLSLVTGTNGPNRERRSIMRRLRRLSSVVGMALLAALLLAPAARAQAAVFRFQFQLTGSTPPQG